MISLTHDEAITVVKIKAAIGAMNDLVRHITDHPGTIPSATEQRIIEADYMLNSAEDTVINDDPELRTT